MSLLWHCCRDIWNALIRAHWAHEPDTSPSEIPKKIKIAQDMEPRWSVDQINISTLFLFGAPVWGNTSSVISKDFLIQFTPVWFCPQEEMREGQLGFLKLNAGLFCALMVLKACVFREVVAGSLGMEAWVPVLALPQHGCAVLSKLLDLSGPPCSHQTTSICGPFLPWHTTMLSPKGRNVQSWV